MASTLVLILVLAFAAAQVTWAETDLDEGVQRALDSAKKQLRTLVERADSLIQRAGEEMQAILDAEARIGGSVPHPAPKDTGDDSEIVCNQGRNGDEQSCIKPTA